MEHDFIIKKSKSMIQKIDSIIFIKYSFLLCGFFFLSNIFTYGAGILPYARHDGKVYFLLGKESYGKSRNLWCDFGGRMERSDTGSFIKNAVREFCEETGTSKNETSTLISACGSAPFVQFRKYRMYLIEIPFKQSKKFSSDGEKKEFAWIDAQFLINIFKYNRNHKRSHRQRGLIVFSYDENLYKLRPVFSRTFNILLDECDGIKKGNYDFSNSSNTDIIVNLIKRVDKGESNKVYVFL